MKKIILFCICISSISFGQIKKHNETEGIQTSIKFDVPQDREAAVNAYLQKNSIGKHDSFVKLPSNADKSGTTHQRNQQYFKGIKVEYGMMITHGKEGKVDYINGEVYDATSVDINPSISNAKGLSLILDSKPGQVFLWDDAIQSKALNYSKPAGELVIFPDIYKATIHLAYKYDVYTTKPVSRDEIYVDAHSGQILFSNAIIKHANDINKNIEIKSLDNLKNKSTSQFVLGNAATRFSGNKQIETTFDLSYNAHVLRDMTRGGGISTFNSLREPSYVETEFTDVDNNWTAAEFNNTNKDNVALDAHWGAMITYDFWNQIFQRNSYDGLGTQLKSFVHYRKTASTSMSNAFWNGAAMSYGDGSGSGNPFTGLDICGHEIGHAICSSTADLAYRNQSGALNEGFSDIWGACIEKFGFSGNINGMLDANVWNIGETIYNNGNILRSMSSPNDKGDPDTFKGTYWITTADDGACVPNKDTNDYCGVHSNSGVLNHWFYILTDGKSGTNNGPDGDVYDVVGIGMSKSAQIAYYAERDYLTPNSTFFDARNATIQIASNLYCSTSQEYKSVKDAWFAVNIGEADVRFSTDLFTKSLEQNLSSNCGEVNNPIVVFENSGANPVTTANIQFSIDGGDLINQTWTGSLAPCGLVNYQINLPVLSRGNHVLAVTVNTSNDGNDSNNSKTRNIFVNSAGDLSFVNTFENVSDQLISYNQNGTSSLWQMGFATATTILTNAVAQNSKVYGTNLAGNYPDNTKSFLVTQCYDLRFVSNPVLKFDMAFDLEQDYDVLYMQYSINGGTTWNLLGNEGPNWYNSSRVTDSSLATPDCQLCPGGQWTGEAAKTTYQGITGTNGQRKQYQLPLTEFGNGSVKPQANMLFRFVFHSDSGVVKQGAIIDNLTIEGVLKTNESSFENFSVSPNPSNGTVNVVLNSSEDVSLNLFDIRGRKVFSNTFDNNNTIFNQEVNFGTLEKGIYLLNVISDGKQATKKLIIN